MKLLNHTLSYLSVAFFLVIGIWAAIFYFNMLDEIYDSIDDGLENSKILIVQKAQEDSTIIHRTNFMESNYAMHEIKPDHAHRFRDQYLDSTLYMVNEEDYEPVRILKSAYRAQNGKYYELHVVSSMVEEDDLVEDLFYSIVWLYVILLASILIINNLILKRVWKPFYQLLERLKKFRVESPDPPVAIKTNVTEFQMLNDSLNTLLERTIATFNSQRQFIENASHELQTPLAIGINKLELLAEKKTITPDNLQEIGAVIQSLERLTRLNKTLLLLSKIENRQFPEQKPVNLNEATDQMIAELSDLAEYKTVQVTSIHQATLLHKMNPELASIMIGNLLKNAIVHNIPGGTVTITVGSSKITVENTATNLALDATQIFKRFYKNNSTSTSTGLGLAIVKSIADYYGFTIDYSFNGKHSFHILLQ